MKHLTMTIHISMIYVSFHNSKSKSFSFSVWKARTFFTCFRIDLDIFSCTLHLTTMLANCPSSLKGRVQSQKINLVSKVIQIMELFSLILSPNICLSPLCDHVLLYKMICVCNYNQILYSGTTWATNLSPLFFLSLDIKEVTFMQMDPKVQGHFSDILVWLIILPPLLCGWKGSHCPESRK